MDVRHMGITTETPQELFAEASDIAKEFSSRMNEYETLSRMIVDTLVEDSKDEAGKVRIKFLAVPGGCGPEITIARGLATTLRDKLHEYLK